MFTLQLTIAGIVTGSVYALIAIGIVLIYKCSGVVNFAQGAYAMLGAYIIYFLAGLGLPNAAAIVLGVAVMALIGAATERIILRPMLKAPIVAVMMVTLGLLIVFKGICLAIWGPDQIPFPQIFPAGSIDIGGINVTYNYVAAMVLSVLLSAGFLAIYRYTRLGLMQRCAADNTRAALAIGIHVNNQISIAWATSAALAGLGGMLLATLNSLSVGLSDIGLVAFPVIVVGGLNSLPGALFAGLLLGVLQQFTSGLLTPVLESFLRARTTIDSVGALEGVVPYALLVLMLMLRPQGLLGTKSVDRV